MEFTDVSPLETYSKKQIQFSEEVLIGKKKVPIDVIINKWGSLLTEDRKERMAQVVEQRTRNVGVILENIYDRGNISAVMRSAEALGFLNFHIIENKNERFKVANRVTQGTDKWLDIHTHESSENCVKSLQAKGFKVYATRLSETAESIEEVNSCEKVALVFGNEKEGVTNEILEACDGEVIIPMHGFAQSFNISVAAAIGLYHIFWQRKSRMGQSGDLTELEKKMLIANYILRSVDQPDRYLNQFLN